MPPSEPDIARELRAIGQAFLEKADELDAAENSDRETG
jgi:hypothetical protein